MAQTIPFRRLPRKIRMAIEDAIADEHPGKSLRYGNFIVETSGSGKFKRRMKDDGEVDHFAIIDINEGRLSSPLDEMELHPGYAMATFSVGFDDTVEGSLFIREEDLSGGDAPRISQASEEPEPVPETDAGALDYEDFEQNPKKRRSKKAKKKTAKKKTAKKKTAKKRARRGKGPALISPEEHPLLHTREPQKEYVDRVMKGIFGWNYKTSGVLDEALMETYVSDAKLAHSAAKRRKLVER